MAKSVSSVVEAPTQARAIDLIRNRKRAYQETFIKDMASEIVMEDLARFCRAGKSTFDPDPRVHALLEGRKEVWLRIANHLNLTEEELYTIFVRGK